MLTPDQPVLGQKYRLIRQLEVGGMGSVWLAEHVHLKSLVAVKLMGREVAATSAGTERFLREARTAASLRSPHVVQILDYGVHEGTPFIAMELLEGESLAARLQREGRFRSWQRMELMLRYVARAVGRAHDAGIVHRDLKPANIFLVRDEEEEVVKLLDFGIAKTTLVVPNGWSGSSTRTGEFLGSPAYASPEQLQASKTLDQRADIWSLGVIAYECLIGRPPFTGDTLVGVVLAICSDPLPVPSQRGAVPAGFDAWFARTCARDVEDRFQSVREASAELRRLVAAACGSSLPPSEPESGVLSAPEPPESVPGVQTPPSAPASVTMRRSAFSARAPARESTAPAQRSQTIRAGLGAANVQRGRRRRLAALLAVLIALAALPLLLFARTLASRALLDRSVLGLGAASPGQPATTELAPSPPAPSQPAPSEVVARHDVPPPGDELFPNPPRDEGPPRSDEPLRSNELLRSNEPAPSDEQPPTDDLPQIDGPPSSDEPPCDLPSDSAPSTKPSRSQPHAASPPAPPPPTAAKPPPPRPAARRAGQARLTITASTPSGVLLDGVPIGSTPLDGIALEPGVHEVTFLRDGERSVQSVELRAGEHKRVAARLEAASGDGLDEAAVQRTLRSYGPSVRDICWERALSTRAPGDPSSVRISATITVAPSGRVQSVLTSGAPAAYPELAGCIEEKVRVWRFPSALGETLVHVPFVFVAE